MTTSKIKTKIKSVGKFFILGVALFILVILLFLRGKTGPAPVSQNELVFYLVAYQGEATPESLPQGSEKFGCEDFLVPYKTKTDKDVNLKTALDSLFPQKETFLPNGIVLHNTLRQTARVDIDIGEEKDKITVNLVGEITPAGVCDDPRIRQQIEKTVDYYSPSAVILLNGSESAWRCFGDQSGLCK